MVATVTALWFPSFRFTEFYKEKQTIFLNQCFKEASLTRRPPTNPNKSLVFFSLPRRNPTLGKLGLGELDT